VEPEGDFLVQPIAILGSEVGKGPMDPLQSWGCHLGAGGYHEGIIPSSILKFCGMYVICIEDDALFKGEGDVIP